MQGIDALEAIDAVKITASNVSDQTVFTPAFAGVTI